MAIRYSQLADAPGQPPEVDVLVFWDAVLTEISVHQLQRRELAVELALVYRQITTRQIDV